jgi:hypothetical protein
MGWDEFFVRKSYPVYVIDQSWRGRSAGSVAAINAVKTGKTPMDQLPTVFSAGHEAAWAIFRFGPEYPKVFDGMRYPLNAQAEFWKQMVPDWSNSVPTPNPTVPALSELAQKLRGTVLISHSQSGIYPFPDCGFEHQGGCRDYLYRAGGVSGCGRRFGSVQGAADPGVMGGLCGSVASLGAAVEGMQSICDGGECGGGKGGAAGAAGEGDTRQLPYVDAG